MKQENSRKTESKPIVSHSTTTPSRLRAAAASSKTTNNKEEEQEAINGDGASSTNPVSKTRTRRSIVLNKPKSVSVDNVVVDSPTPKGIRELDNCRIVGRSSGCRPIVEQFSRPTSRRTDLNRSKNELLDPDWKNTKKKSNNEFQEKLALSETSIKNLQSQVLDLQSELDKAHCLNAELQSQNKKLTEDLTAAEATIETLAIHDQLKRESISEYQTPKFKDIQKLIANKLEHPKLNKKVASIEPTTCKSSLASPVHPISIAADKHKKLPVNVNPSAPPLPPPPPPRPPPRSATTQKAPAFVDFYHSLTKREGKKESPGPAIHNKPVAASSAHSSIVGEFENRSAHLMAIKADIETKGEFINGLIQRVLAAAYTDIEDVLKFADWLDNELSSLADERAVLKHFKWPERKADAMREAAIEYRELKVLECEISSYKDDTDLPCGAVLKKIASLLDKSERSIQRLIKLRNSVMRNYQDYKIPTDWMLDSGIVRKIKKTSMKLAKIYMKRVTIELESFRNSERESAQEALMLQGVHFAYRAHKFAGGLDSETLCALEEIRRRFQDT